MSKAVLDVMVQHMDKAIQALKSDLSKVRTGRASPALLDSIHVDYYGSSSPLKQIANVTTPDARTLQVVPWETGLIGAIEKAILAANLGFTPQSDGKMIRIPLPPLTEERRKEMVKGVKRTGEEAKVSVRNFRREANDELKKQEKAKVFSEDEVKKGMDQVQKKTDEKIAEIDHIIASKEKEVMTI